MHFAYPIWEFIKRRSKEPIEQHDTSSMLEVAI
jgi:hypothetical protein